MRWRGLPIDRGRHPPKIRGTSGRVEDCPLRKGEAGRMYAERGLCRLEGGEKYEAKCVGKVEAKLGAVTVELTRAEEIYEVTFGVMFEELM